MGDITGLRKLTATQQRFLRAYARCARISKAATAVKIDRVNHYVWLKEDESYRRVWPEIREQAAQQLEDAAVERAMDGVKRAVRYKGKVVGHEREYSDAMLMFLLKGMKPETYRDRSDQRITMGFHAEELAKAAAGIQGDPDDHD